MNRNPSELCTTFLRSLRYLQKHYSEPCSDSLAALESQGLTDFRTRSTSFIILKTLQILVKDGTKLVWNKTKYPDEATIRLACQVLDLAVEKNIADKVKSQTNIKEKARVSKIIAQQTGRFTTNRSLVSISIRITSN
jgi:hypothetical protein